MLVSDECCLVCCTAGSVMQLLTHLYSEPSGLGTAVELSELVPRLWPFLRHTLTSVRLACVRFLTTLLQPGQGVLLI